MATHRVDLIDEDDAGRILFALLEHVAHAARADANKHLDKVGAGNREERHVRLAGNRAGEQGLAGARRPDEQHSLRDLAAEPLEFLRIFQVFDDFFEFLLGLVDPGDILESDPPDLLGQKAGPALAEAHGPPAAALHLTHEKYPHADQQQHRKPGDQHAKQRGYVFVDRSRGYAYVFLGQSADKIGIVRGIGRERPAVGEMTADVVALNRDIGNLAAIDVVKKIGKRKRRLRSPAGGCLEQVEEGDEKQSDYNPQGEILAEIVHSGGLSVPGWPSRAETNPTPSRAGPRSFSLCSDIRCRQT